MTAFTKYHSDGFYRTLAAVATGGSFALVFAASLLPEGLQRGDLLVDGSGFFVAALATAVLLRAAYARGFRKALRIAATTPDYRVTA